MANHNTLRIDGGRLWQSLMTMGEIGATDGGGVARIALGEEDRAARDLFVDWCKAAGLAARVDRLGNVFGRRQGRDPTCPPVLMGSHLDSQPKGGRFDGAFGVLAALEVVRSLNDAGIETEAPIEIVNWSDEEGCRFGAGMWASAAFAGLMTVDDALATADWQGTTVGGELERIGYAGTAPVGGYPIDCFLECHIEQGPRLEVAGLKVGIVTGASAQRVYRVTVKGVEGHAGTVPMAERRDALLGAARMVDALHALAVATDDAIVLTIGAFDVLPNGRSTIPSKVVFAVDNRHPGSAVLNETAIEIEGICKHIAGDLGLDVEITEQSRRDKITFDPGLNHILRNEPEHLGLGYLELTSGAGHDACKLAHLAPTTMIFVPCRGGASHREDEWAEPEDLEAGANLLLRTVLARAG
ncbi:MAG: Zn-dependent hydrolase [Geminicoccaceae bacterium]